MTRGQLIAERVRLERRLWRGWAAIDRAEAEGRSADADRYTDAWLEVLRDYEETCDELRAREGRLAGVRAAG